MDFLLRFTRSCVMEGAKAHYRIKHAKFEFAKKHKHINDIENVFASYSCNCAVKGDMRNSDLLN
ncbi:hypothetical protein [Campylobacter troglodytis]|uniref:hypothetical protein n=1 Tax=Campylobacter troglodytis TaxID=654363 RepID=UPI00115BA793|nr:hypothetical protein [Campylobacter troglodytis]